MSMSMSISAKTTVLVVGGPGGSYTAAVLAREGIATVLLEADMFPRYHIGESMIPSFREFLRFIDLDEEFDAHGFVKMVGAAFKLVPSAREGYTDFLEVGGPAAYTWNVVRSEADDMLFRHTGKSGAMIFDGVKVISVQFEDSNATYTIAKSKKQGSIEFEYLVDATGRACLLNTKYLKDRHYNVALKSVAHWAYYENAGGYHFENVPFFEALNDKSGWAWLIPLHNKTTSVGIVRHQATFTKKKRTAGSTETYFDSSLSLCPVLTSIIGPQAKRVSDIRSASDYSYHSSTYALPHARIVGDAGAFIDPFFSSGVHLAIAGGLSAATTICASLRGDVTEEDAGDWHSVTVREGYARFLIVVLGAYKQMKSQKEDILHDFHEDNFDRAFSFFSPVIQGRVDADVGNRDKLSREEFAQTVELMGEVFGSRGKVEAFEEQLWRLGVGSIWRGWGEGAEYGQGGVDAGGGGVRVPT